MNRLRALPPIAVVLLCLAAAALGLPPSPTIAGELVPEPVLVLPAELDPVRWGAARCNDGTPFGFMLEPSPTGSREWVLLLEGGGFCEDQCAMCDGRDLRWTTGPGAEALAFYETLRANAIFSPDAGWNPVFHDANKVYAFYCSSDAWSGNTTERRPTTGDPAGWYFSGRANVRAMVEALKTLYGLHDAQAATEVLFAGMSAGGKGVQATADLVYRRVPRVARSGRLRLVNDAGSVFVFDDPDHRFLWGDLTFKQAMVDTYDFWGSTLWRNDRWSMGPAGQTLREVPGRFWEDQPPEVVIHGNP